MILNVPHTPQPNDYTCGPSALQMILTYYKIPVTLNNIARKCKTTERSGTSRPALIKAARYYGLTVHAHSSANLAEVRRAIDAKNPVLINYRPADFTTGHYAVVIGYTKTHLLLNDPWLGKTYQLSYPDFVTSWHGYQLTKNRHWMMTIAHK